MTGRLRRARPGDGALSYAIYVDAVLNGTAPLYTAAEARAWAPDATPPAGWTERVEGAASWIAEDAAGPAGFLTLREDGHLDLFFVRPDRRGRGTAARLYDAAQAHARTRGLRMTAHASLLARPFLERRGWTMLRREDVPRGGQVLTRFFMEGPAAE